MNIFVIRILVIVLSIGCIGSSVFILSRKRTNLYFKLILLAVICFAITGMHLVYTYGLMLENDSLNFSLSFLGLASGFIFHIAAERCDREENFDYSKKANDTSLSTTIACVVAFLTIFSVIKINDGTSLIIGRFIPLLFILGAGGFSLFYFLRNVSSSTKNSQSLKIIKTIDILMIVELAVGIVFTLCGVNETLLPMGISLLIFMIIQGAIIFLVYRSCKHE